MSPPSDGRTWVVSRDFGYAVGGIEPSGEVAMFEFDLREADEKSQ